MLAGLFDGMSKQHAHSHFQTACSNGKPIQGKVGGAVLTCSVSSLQARLFTYFIDKLTRGVRDCSHLRRVRLAHAFHQLVDIFTGKFPGMFTRGEIVLTCGVSGLHALSTSCTNTLRSLIGSMPWLISSTCGRQRGETIVRKEGGRCAQLYLGQAELMGS